LAHSGQGGSSHGQSDRRIGQTLCPNDSIGMPHTAMLSAFDAVAWTGPVRSAVAHATSAPGIPMS
jgi:hypothetical protein